ncbi:MAG TPA: glucodextranase DOMON-like domain-containing protein [Acidimicrobiales bacterium]|nr:glucodextranase DOMON-like domain-containing protein [Acidimicrobiales bacterium]
MKVFSFGQRRRRWPKVAVLAALAAGPTSALSPAVASATAVPLVQAFDNVGISMPSAPSGGNFDGIGDSFSSASLAADALVPGGALLHDGLSLTWPDVAPGQADNVLANGQTVAVTGQGSTLGIVGASAYGSAGGTFTVNYADGTTTSAYLSFADWVDQAPVAGTDFLATTGGWAPGGTIPVHLSYATIGINPGEQVVSVTLPTVAGSVAYQQTSLHVFAMTVGTPGTQAVGAPGALSYYDQGRKDCVGTAADTASKVWYTVAGGHLSDTYAPTIDNTDVKSLDPIVTGPGFTALQPRDMTYAVAKLGATGMACRVVALDSAQHFAVVSDFVTNPLTEAVVIQVSLVTLPGAPRGLHVYLRFNPLLNGHGGGGADNAGAESATVVQTADGPVPLAYSTNSFTEATNRDYATPIYAALAASQPFAAVETGFAGTASDGLSELDTSGSLTTTASDADNGNVVQTVELSMPAHPSTSGAPQQGGRVPTALGAYGAPGTPAGAPAACGPSSPGPGPLADLSVPSITPMGIAAAVASAAGLSAPLPPGSVSSQTVSLGFGQDEQSALQSALSSSAVPFASTYTLYQAQWLAYDSQLCGPGAISHPPAPASAAGPGPVPPTKLADAYWLSANVIKASEDKTFLGATAASLASPWGQSVPAGNYSTDNLAPYFGSYREVFPRDAYETFTGFLVDGDLSTARQMVEYWFNDMQRADGSFPRNGLLNGKAAPDTGGLQLDETADPILAAWQAGLAGDSQLYQEHIKPAADFLVANGPETASSVERWEEQNGYSASTMADEVAGLVAAGRIALVQKDAASSRLFLATADNFRRLILATTVTTNGPLSAQPYFIRVDKTGDPDQAYNYYLGNGNPTPADQRSVIDQGFLEMTRLGELAATDPTVTNSLAVAAKTIDVGTASGAGVLRYNGDGYGDCEQGQVSSCGPTGAPWAPTSTGTGHPWPVLSGENGEYQILAGNSAALQSDLSFMLGSASGVGLVPEQVWNYADVPASPYGSDPATASIGFTNGQPDGSAAPLTWAQAQLLRLIRDASTNSLLEQPSIVADRYLPTAPPAVPLQVSAPLAVAGGNVPANMLRPSVSVDASTPGVTVVGGQATLTVTATTLPGATVDIAATGNALGTSAPTTTVATVVADSAGTATAAVALEPGTNNIEVASVASGNSGGTNEALFSVDNLIVPGTVVLNATGPADGGYGPGTYAYPTVTNGNGSPMFPPGSFQLSGLTVIDSGPTVTFQIGVANLVNTFGSPDGAQLFDLYIHSPNTTQTQSTAAASPWNYSIAPRYAWNQLIEVDGFNTDDWVTPASSTSGLDGSSNLGTPQISVAQLSQQTNGYTPGVVSITVPASTLGAPDAGGSWSGWAFTVTVTGQDGYGYYDARTFDSTAGAYNFGECTQAAITAGNPICGLEPSSLPYVMDTIPPAGVDVQQELNPTLGPVVLQGVSVS